MSRNRQEIEISLAATQLFDAQLAAKRAHEAAHVCLDYPVGLFCDGDMLTLHEFQAMQPSTIILMLSYYAWPFLGEKTRDLCRQKRQQRKQANQQ